MKNFVFRGLRDCDIMSKSDPMVVLFYKDLKSGQFYEVITGITVFVNFMERVSSMFLKNYIPN